MCDDCSRNIVIAIKVDAVRGVMIIAVTVGTGIGHCDGIARRSIMKLLKSRADEPRNLFSNQRRRRKLSLYRVDHHILLTQGFQSEVRSMAAFAFSNRRLSVAFRQKLFDKGIPRNVGRQEDLDGSLGSIDWL